MAKWLYEIKGWGKVIESEAPFEAKRSALVALLRGSEWFKVIDQAGIDDELEFAILDLEESPSEEDADQAIWSIYNLADSDRVWLSPS
jgi:hypothetical protein